jgi:hypothetical protein
MSSSFSPAALAGAPQAIASAAADDPPVCFTVRIIVSALVPWLPPVRRLAPAVHRIGAAAMIQWLPKSGG